MLDNDLYTGGKIINYEEGDQSLQRDRIIHREDLEDELHTIKQGETLTSIAFRYYRKSKLWYLIADVNNIENPTCLKIGMNLIIPNYKKYNL